MDEISNEFLSRFRSKHSINLEEIADKGLIAISGKRIDSKNYASVIVLENESGRLLYSSGGPIKEGNNNYTADKALQQVIDSIKYKTKYKIKRAVTLLVYQCTRISLITYKQKIRDYFNSLKQQTS